MVDKTLLRKSERRPVMSDSLQPQGLILAWVAGFPSPGDLPNPGIEPKSPALQVDSSPAEPQGKPKNTGGSSLSLLQRHFPTQESNRGLLHYRRIRYPLSYQGRSSCICPRYCQFILPAPSPTASTSSLSAPVSVSLSCIRTVLGTLLLHWHF